MDDRSGKPHKGFVRSMLELLGLAESAETSRRERRANIVYVFVMLVVTLATRGLSLGKQALVIALAALVAYLVISTVFRFLPEPRRRSDIPPGSH